MGISLEHSRRERGAAMIADTDTYRHRHTHLIRIPVPRLDSISPLTITFVLIDMLG